MQVYIKHISPIYIDTTTFDDVEIQKEIAHVEVIYDFCKGKNQMGGRIDMDFREYEHMKHNDLIAYVKDHIEKMM